jgi:CRISPR/Cas system-associated exonuclease Cas4 (RecB family)
MTVQQLIQAGPEPGPRVLSPSQVNAYLECPFCWYCSSVLRLPEPVTHSLAVGRAVHTAAALLMTAKQSGQAPDAEGLGEACAIACDLQLTQIETPQARDEEEDAEQLADVAACEDQVRALTTLWWTAAAPSIQPAKIETAVSGTIAGVPVNGIIDIVDQSGALIDLKTASRKPNGISPRHRLQMITYAMLDQPANESHTVRLDYLTKTKTPAYVQLKTGLGEEDYRYAENIYPMVAEAMDAGIYPPHRSGNLCSRQHCAHWQACEASFGGRVRD